MPEQRIAEHLAAVDAWHAQCTREYPLSFDEWNATNAVMGRAPWRLVRVPGVL